MPKMQLRAQSRHAQVYSVLKRDYFEVTPTVTPLRIGNETEADREACRNFRRNSRAQVHVISRHACDDMSFGREAGHVGDMN